MSTHQQTNEPVRGAATGRGVKLVQLVGMLLIVGGVVTCIVAPSWILAGANAVFFGLCFWVAGRFAAWWKYG